MSHKHIHTHEMHKLLTRFGRSGRIGEFNLKKLSKTETACGNHYTLHGHKISDGIHFLSHSNFSSDYANEIRVDNPRFKFELIN